MGGDWFSSSLLYGCKINISPDDFAILINNPKEWEHYIMNNYIENYSEVTNKLSIPNNCNSEYKFIYARDEVCDRWSYNDPGYEVGTIYFGKILENGTLLGSLTDDPYNDAIEIMKFIYNGSEKYVLPAKIYSIISYDEL
jgi:hypothetical protein